jgi:hypothetical protein
VLHAYGMGPEAIAKEETAGMFRAGRSGWPVDVLAGSSSNGESAVTRSNRIRKSTVMPDRERVREEATHKNNVAFQLYPRTARGKLISTPFFATGTL